MSPSEIYIPTSGVWVTTASMSEFHVDAPSVLLGDGTVLVAGGEQKPVFGGSTAAAEIFDPGVAP